MRAMTTPEWYEVLSGFLHSPVYPLDPDILQLPTVVALDLAQLEALLHVAADSAALEAARQLARLPVAQQLPGGVISELVDALPDSAEGMVTDMKAPRGPSDRWSCYGACMAVLKLAPATDVSAELREEVWRLLP